MLNDRLAAARKIAAEIFTLESDIESTFLRATRLSAAIVEGRRNARMPISAGQDSLRELAAATTLLIEARTCVAAAQASLAEERIHAGLRLYGMGDVDDCPAANGRLPTVVQDNQVAA